MRFIYLRLAAAIRHDGSFVASVGIYVTLCLLAVAVFAAGIALAIELSQFRYAYF